MGEGWGEGAQRSEPASPASATATEALAQATARLRAAGIAAPAREARLLLAHAQRAAMLPDRHAPVPAAFWALLDRRAGREPMAHITGRQGFWTLDLAVSPDTLIPRADTETLIEAALAAFPDRTRVRRVLDLGTGTGALLLAALMEFPAAWGVGVDRSPAACRLARDNAIRAGLAGRACLLAGDWAAALRARFDLVLANPPYVPRDEIAALMPEVARFEPAPALDGGADGLDAYRAIVPALPALLAAGGVAVLEVGQGQAAAVAALMAGQGLGDPWVRADLAGIGRAVAARAAAPSAAWSAAPQKTVGSAPVSH